MATEPQTPRPCPFCGNKKPEPRRLMQPAAGTTHYVYCIVCGANGPAVKGRDESIISWNTREKESSNGD